MTFNEWVALIVGFILIGEAVFLVYFLWRNYKEESKKLDNNTELSSKSARLLKFDKNLYEEKMSELEKIYEQF
jgi:large-conductance mechanosensitive channel